MKHSHARHAQWQVPWAPTQSVLQPVKATAAFHDAPWFDSVAVRCIDGIDYAQLRLLFRWGLMRWVPAKMGAVAIWCGCWQLGTAGA